MHVCAEGYHVNRVEAPAVKIEESNDVQSRNLSVEGVGILQVVVPHLVHDVAEELGASTLGGFVVSKVFELGFVSCFRSDTDDGSGIVWDGTVIERETRRAYERRAPVGRGILGRVREESCQGMDSAHSIKWDDHEDGQEHLSDGEEVVIRWFSLDGREDIKRLPEEEGDSVRSHCCLDGSLGSRLRAVQYRDDDDGRNSVGNCKVGRFRG